MPRCYLVKKTKYFGLRDWDSPVEISDISTDIQSFSNPQESIARTEDRILIGGDHDIGTHDGEIPFFRIRTSEEREIAEDLLELSRSLPPRPKPTFISIVPPTPIHFYPPLTPTESPLLDSQDSAPTFTLLTSPEVIHNSLDSSNTLNLTSHETTPLTPTTSEYSSDAENICPSNEETLDVGSEEGGASVEEKDSSANYSFEDLLIVDGRRRVTHRIHRPIKKCRLKSRGRRKEPKDTPHYRHLGRSRIKSYREDFLDDEISELGESDEEGETRTRFTCSECGKHYATSSNLSRHKQTHRSLDSQNAKRCPTCGKAYVSMPALSMHLLTHNLVHKCDVCGKGFSRPWLLQGHKRSHTGEKPYACANCGKTFADRSNLRAHMQTHSPAKNYKCRNCHKSFALKSYLNKHYDSACFKDPVLSDSCSSRD